MPESGDKAATASRDSARTSRGRSDALLAVAAMLALWKVVSLGVGKEIILPPPERVIEEFATIVATVEFGEALAATAARGAAAFALSMTLGVGLGLAMGSSPRIKSASAPVLTVIRATPVLAIILIALIWFPSGTVPIFSALVMAFPVVAADVAEGVESADHRLIAMARSFSVPRRRVIAEIRIPSALPHVLSAARNALGLSWKVIVAGEVLSQPRHAVGTGMQTARLALDTAQVFAWAAVGVLLCALSDALIDAIARRFRWRAR